MQGIIHRLIRGKGFGFIQAEGRQFFFHHSEVREIAFKQLTLGDVVEFQAREEEEGKNPRAVEIIVVEKKEPPPRRQQPAEPARKSASAGRRGAQGGARERGRGRAGAGSERRGKSRGRRSGSSREQVGSRDGAVQDPALQDRSLEDSPSPGGSRLEELVTPSPRGGEREMRRAARGEPGDDEWQFGPSSGSLDEDTFSQLSSKRIPRADDPLGHDSLADDPLADEGEDYFGSDSRTDRGEERARPGRRELDVEDDGEFIPALPDESGREPRPRHASARGGSERRREGNGSRGASRGRRKSGREKQRRPKASGLPGERGEGVVRAINSERGFGFIETPTGDIFFHKSGVREDFTLLNIGARVAFVFGQGDNGIKAEDVAVLG